MNIHHGSGLTPIAPYDQARLADVASQVIAAYPQIGVVQLVMVDDAYMTSLNQTYREKASTTDVLSFRLDDPDGESIPFAIPGDLEKAGGEIYISLRQAGLQAEELGVTMFEELARLLTHGLLHLAGYEHDSETELLHMERETDRLLQSSGLLPVSI